MGERTGGRTDWRCLSTVARTQCASAAGGGQGGPLGPQYAQLLGARSAASDS